MTKFARRSFRKKRVSRRFKRRVTRTLKKKQKMFISKDVISYMPMGKLPYPPRYRTKLHIGVAGNIPAATTSGAYSILQNGVFHPFNAAAVSGLLTNIPGSLIPVANLAPVGFSNMCGAAAIYNSYRVFASSVKIQFIPGSVADTVNATLIPVIYQTVNGVTSSTYTYPTSSTEAMELPFAKNKLFMANQQGSPLKHSISQHKLFGVKKASIVDDIYTYTGTYASLPVNKSLWMMFFETADATGLGSPLSYRLDVTYTVEFFNMEGPVLKQT